MKPSLPKGVRDFGPDEVDKRNYIFDTIKAVFVKYGYRPIETPVMENLSTLTGKYGEEGDRLLFKVLNNGDFLNKADADAFAACDSKRFVPSVSKRGLRFDLTVPFARYVAQRRNDLSFPFKRYQIQPVWRGDRPQKGRYQEFYQCDVDVVGSDSLMYEAELVQIYDEVFAHLGLNVSIRLSNRKILAGMAETAGIPDQFSDMTVAIDKLDKVGAEGVAKELAERGISGEAIASVMDMLRIRDLDALEERFGASAMGMEGVAELRAVYRYLDRQTTVNEVVFDITLARGLNYYTGCIFEVVSKDVTMGSIGGGGRYDDLTGIFGLKDVSGVGVSFGAARIYDVMTELDAFPESTGKGIKVLLMALGQEAHEYAYSCLNTLRANGIASDLYPSPAKMKKMMKYANDIAVPYIIVIGSEEMETGMLQLKNMETREQFKATAEDIAAQLEA